MSENDIKCPHCGKLIPINDLLKHRLNEQVNSEVSRRLENETTKITDELKQKFSVEASEKLKLYEQKLKFETEKRAEAQIRELDFIKKQNELEDKLKNQEIEIARRMQEEKKLLEEKSQIDAEEKFKLIIAEKNKKLEEQKKLNDEMNRKLHQGSMQTQGEILELALEELLAKKFPLDEIEPVPKGISGADIIQKVFTPNKQPTGIIAWESKRTKAWTEEWVTKLKDDGAKIKANICVLVSEVLPKEIPNFGIYNGIWVCNFSSIVGLASALRNQLIYSHKIIIANQGKNEKKDILYDYLTSHTFAERVRSSIETFMNMKKSLDIEKNAMTKLWASRETQIVRFEKNISAMFGEIEGIAGAELPSIGILELEAAVDANIEDNKKKPEKETPNNQTNLF